jgi:hypothetical protein
LGQLTLDGDAQDIQVASALAFALIIAFFFLSAYMLFKLFQETQFVEVPEARRRRRSSLRLSKASIDLIQLWADDKKKEDDEKMEADKKKEGDKKKVEAATTSDATTASQLEKQPKTEEAATSSDATTASQLDSQPANPTKSSHVLSNLIKNPFLGKRVFMRATHSYDDKRQTHLSFACGDFICMLEWSSKPTWCYAVLLKSIIYAADIKQIGLVPSNYFHQLFEEDMVVSTAESMVIVKSEFRKTSKL